MLAMGSRHIIGRVYDSYQAIGFSEYLNNMEAARTHIVYEE